MVDGHDAGRAFINRFFPGRGDLVILLLLCALYPSHRAVLLEAAKILDPSMRMEEDFEDEGSFFEETLFGGARHAVRFRAKLLLGEKMRNLIQCYFVEEQRDPP